MQGRNQHLTVAAPGVTADPVQQFALTFRMPQTTAVLPAPPSIVLQRCRNDTCNGPRHLTSTNTPRKEHLHPARSSCTCEQSQALCNKATRIKTERPSKCLSPVRSLQAAALPGLHQAQTLCSSACRCPLHVRLRHWHGGAREWQAGRARGAPNPDPVRRGDLDMQ